MIVEIGNHGLRLVRRSSARVVEAPHLDSTLPNAPAVDPFPFLPQIRSMLTSNPGCFGPGKEIRIAALFQGRRRHNQVVKPDRLTKKRVTNPHTAIKSSVLEILGDDLGQAVVLRVRPG